MRAHLSLLMTTILVISPLTHATGSYLLPSPHEAFKVNHFGQIQRYSKFQNRLDQTIDKGMQPLAKTWGSDAIYKSAAYLVQNDDIYSAAVEKYLNTLALHKAKLMTIYKLKNSTYNKLVALSFGIFGVESKFGTHWKYKFKEKHQALISFLKSMNGGDPTNSRGLTQIKDIPDTIEKYYPQITADTLYDPAYAAVATLGYLAETLKMIRGFRNNQMVEGVQPGKVSLAYITDENIFDYIPYVYNGRMKNLFNPPTAANGASVVDNLYIQEMQQHMRWLFTMEMP